MSESLDRVLATLLLVQLLSDTPLGKQWRMAEVIGPLLHTWEPQTKLLAAAWSRPTCCVVVWGVNPQTEDLSLSVSLLFKQILIIKALTVRLNKYDHF